MAFLGSVALGYLAASFVVSFYFAASAWGTPGTVLTIIIMATFPAMPIWFAQNGLWSHVAVCCALLIINSLVFWSVQTTERVSRRGRLLAATVLAAMVIPSV